MGGVAVMTMAFCREGVGLTIVVFCIVEVGSALMDYAVLYPDRVNHFLFKCSFSLTNLVPLGLATWMLVAFENPWVARIVVIVPFFVVVYLRHRALMDWLAAQRRKGSHEFTITASEVQVELHDCVPAAPDIFD